MLFWAGNWLIEIDFCSENEAGVFDVVLISWLHAGMNHNAQISMTHHFREKAKILILWKLTWLEVLPKSSLCSSSDTDIGNLGFAQVIKFS